MQKIAANKKGLCLGGYAPVSNARNYDIIFYETEWSKKWLLDQNVTTKLLHAFGVNKEIYRPLAFPQRIWTYITVGAFSNWKRQEKMLDKLGTRLAVGEIQMGNLEESANIALNLLVNGVAVSGMVKPEKLAELYNCSVRCYIPAELIGGGERAVLEARACGTEVEVEDDNPKLKELTQSLVWDQDYYASQLKEGILSCLN